MSSILGHSVQFAKNVRCSDFQNDYSHSFHPISTNLYGKYGGRGWIQAIAFVAIWQIMALYFKRKSPQLPLAINLS